MKSIPYTAIGFIISLSLIAIPHCSAQVQKEEQTVSLFPFRLDQKWGYKDATGRVVIEPRYDHADRFSEGMAGVWIEKKAGFIDETGKIVIPLDFESTWPFSEGLALARVKGKWGFIDSTGRMVIEPKYDEAESFSEGRAKVTERNGEDRNGRRFTSRTYYIDKTGKEWDGN